MANLFGSAISDSTGQPGGAVGTSGGPSHARVRKSFSSYVGAPTTSDILVLDYFKSSDLLEDIKFYTTGDSTGGALNIGLYSVDFSNGGTTLTVVDADLFASAKATGTAILHGSATATVFTESTTLTDGDRYKALWELAAIGAASYTSDPGLTFAIVAVPSTTVDASETLIFDIDYVSGD